MVTKIEFAHQTTATTYLHFNGRNCECNLEFGLEKLKLRKVGRQQSRSLTISSSNIQPLPSTLTDFIASKIYPSSAIG